jgi:hypothetical protein
MEKEPLNLLKKLEPRLRRLRISFHTWLDEMLEGSTENPWCQQIQNPPEALDTLRGLFCGIPPKAPIKNSTR